MSLQKGKPNSQQILQTVQQRGPPQIQIPPRGTPTNVGDEYNIQRSMYPNQQMRTAVHQQQMTGNTNPHDMGKQGQPGMPGASNTPMVYSAHLSQQPFYSRQPPPRAQVPAVNQRPGLNLGINPATATQQQQQYYAHSQQAPPQQQQQAMIPLQQINNLQHMYMAGGGAPNQYRFQYPPQQSYQVPTQTQTMYVSTANTPFAYHTANPTVFYSHLMPRHPVPSMPSTSQAQLPKREKKIIRIQDPTTARDVTEEIVGVKSDNSDSRTNEIGAQFATQVAGVLGQQQPPVKEQMPPQHQPAQIQVQQHVASASSTRSAVTIEKSMENIETKTDLSNPVVTSTQIKLSEKNSAEIEISDAQPVNVVTRIVAPPFTLPTFTEQIVDPIAVTAVEPQVEAPVVCESPQLPVEVEVAAPEHVVEAVIVQPQCVVNAPETVVDAVAEDESSSPQENGEAGANEFVDPHAEKWETESKETKKQKSKKNKVYLNRKGESKEGGDMDAFVVDKEEITLPVSSPSVPEESTVDDISSIEEERKVAEKNEENMKVSQDFERNEHVIDVIDQPITKSQTIPKYNYKEDQWSPLNPEGKRQYDRSFLLKMQSQPMSLRKPVGLPDLEVIKDSVTIWSNKTKPFERPVNLAGFQRAHIPDFIPGYVKSSSTPRNAQVNRRPSQQGGSKTEQKKKSIVLSFNPDVRLNKSENAWRPTHKFGKDQDTEALKTADLYKRVRGILNKLTPQKFQTLVNQVNDLSIDTEERLKGVIDLVFEKALDEPNFSVAYANLCKCLALKKVPIGNKEGDYVNFRKLLLNKCQKEFERDTSDDVARIKKAKEQDPDNEVRKRELDEELEDLERKAKRRSLGNIRFIGELFKLHMLTASIMHDCLKKLLNQEDEDSLECLCRLLTTIGKDIDGDKTKSNNKETDDRMNSYFRMMQEIIKKRHTSPRVRFMLQDVTDLRQNNWVPRRDENNPKTLDQIHLEAEREAFEREIALTQPQSHRRMDDKRKRGGIGGGSSIVGEDGWTSVGSKNSSRIDPQKLKLSKVNVDDDIQLGPGGRNSVGWSRGSSGGSRTSSQEPENKSTAPANRFQALANEPSARADDSRRGISRNIPSSSRDSSKGRGTQMAPPAQRGAKTVVPSQKEREQAVAAVKAIAAGEAGRTQVDSSRESSGTREEKKDVALRGNPDLSEEAIEKRAKALVDEFLHNTDFQEAILCVSEMCAPNTISIFVTYAFNCVLERSAQTRQQIGQLMHDLIKAKVMTPDQYIKGLQAILSLAEDYAIDIPHIWEYLGELIAPLIKDGTLPLSFLQEAAQPCFETGCGGAFVSAVLHAVSKKLGTHEVGELWRSSNLQWSHFLPNNIKTEDFIRENKLEFTVKPREPCKNINLSSEQLKTELTALFASKQSENEEIFDWIDAHLNESQCREASFVRALMVAVCQSVLVKSDDATITVDESLFKNRCNILRKYVDHSEAYEMQALYALQALMHQLEQPKGVLNSFFGYLYDEEIISEDAFLQWEMSEDPVEQEGKGVALNSVRSFYIWLKDAENESVEES